MTRKVTLSLFNVAGKSLCQMTFLICTWFVPICQNQIQGLFKDFQGPYKGYIRKNELNQPGTFISIYSVYIRQFNTFKH